MKALQIRNIVLAGQAVLAPMAGVSDLAFRRIARKMGAAMVTSEMISAKGLYYHNERTKSMLAIAPDEHPVALQIFGSDPDSMALAAREAEKAGADAVDINMGCPMLKVVRNGDGSALMKNIPLAQSVIAAVAKAVSIPVTVKMRLGWSRETLNAKDLALAAQEAGASAITVHGRTREEFYTGHADWKEIASVVSAVSIPVIGNGDVTDGPSAKALLEETGCAAVAIGRGAWGNPWVFKEINAYLATGEVLPKPSWEERLQMARIHLTALVKEKGEYVAVREMRTHASRYFHGLPRAAVLRQAIMETATEEAFHHVLSDYEAQNHMHEPDTLPF